MENKSLVIHLIWQHEYITKEDRLIRWVRNGGYASNLVNSRDPGGPIWSEEFVISLDEIKDIRKIRLESCRAMMTSEGILGVFRKLPKEVKMNLSELVLRKELVVREREMLKRLDVGHIFDDEINFFLELQGIGG